jgi:carbon-monoxide dehydrogenase medium subunit
VIPFTYLEPSNLDEALALLTQHGDEAKLIAGGTGLVNFMKQRLVRPRFVIGLRALNPLAHIEEESGLRIGALATLQSLATCEPVRRSAPLLAEACGHVSTVRIRTMATIGGAMAHADPNLDTPPALMAMDGQIVARSQRGQRTIPTDRSFIGYYETVLAPDDRDRDPGPETASRLRHRLPQIPASDTGRLSHRLRRGVSPQRRQWRHHQEQVPATHR